MADNEVRRMEGPDWKRPKGYSWHHHEDGKRMQLVPTVLHDKVGYMTCPPNPDPAPMRAPSAAGCGQETLDEANPTHARTDRREAA